MRKALLVFSLLLMISFVIPILSTAEIEKEPQLSYSKAIDCLKDLDMRVAYKRLEVVTRDFPKSEEARKAAFMKAVISATEFSSSDMLATRYSQAVEKAKSDKEKREILKLYTETSGRMIENGKTLTYDAQVLLKYAGKSMSIEVNKGYDSLEFSNRAFLSIKKLEGGELPDLEEITNIEKFQKDVSYRHVLEKVLGRQDLIPEQTIKGEVDWAGTMMLVGNWLVHVGGVNKVGWIDPTTSKVTKSLVQAERSFNIAKQCFEKAKGLTKDPSTKVQAEERIKELNQILKEFELKKERK